MVQAAWTTSMQHWYWFGERRARHQDPSQTTPECSLRPFRPRPSSVLYDCVGAVGQGADLEFAGSIPTSSTQPARWNTVRSLQGIGGCRYPYRGRWLPCFEMRGCRYKCGALGAREASRLECRADACPWTVYVTCERC